MKTPSYKKTNIGITFTTAIVTVLVLISGFYIYKSNLFGASIVQSEDQSQNIDENPPSGEQIQDGNNTKSDSQNESTKTTFKVSLISIGQTENNIQIRVLANIVSSQGNCELTLTKDGQSFTKTSQIQAMPSSSTCMGFDVSKTELSAGEWKIKLTMNIGNQTGILEDSVNVEI